MSGGKLLRDVADLQAGCARDLASVSGLITPIAVFTVVDLPDPLGPISVTISPRARPKSTPRTSQRPLLRTPTLESETSGLASEVADGIVSESAVGELLSHML